MRQIQRKIKVRLPWLICMQLILSMALYKPLLLQDEMSPDVTECSSQRQRLGQQYCNFSQIHKFSTWQHKTSDPKKTNLVSTDIASALPQIFRHDIKTYNTSSQGEPPICQTVERTRSTGWKMGFPSAIKTNETMFQLLF